MRILLAVERSDLRLGLELLLEGEPGFKVVGSITDAASLLVLVKTARPDLVLLEWDLLGQALAELQSRDQAAAPWPVTKNGVPVRSPSISISIFSSEENCASHTPITSLL